MKTSLFIIIVLISGAFAGLIHGTVNFAIVEPYLDQAIGIENQNLFASGEEEDTPEFWVEYEGYRDWQKSGQILAGIILGMSIGSLFGIVFALSRKSLPGNNDIKKVEDASEDVKSNAEVDVQDLTNKYVSKVDDMLSLKEKEIMTV